MLVANTLNGVRLQSKTKDNRNGNLTYLIRDPMKQVHKDDDKSLVILWHYCSICLSYLTL